MSTLLLVLTVTAVSGGAIFFLAGAIGMLRFPDPLTRLHAITKADTLGLGLIVLGLLPLSGSPLAAGKLIALWVVALLASATMGQLSGRLADEAERAP